VTEGRPTHYLLSCAPGRALVEAPEADEPWCEGRAVDEPTAPLVATLDPVGSVPPASMYEGLVPLWSGALLAAVREAGADNLQVSAAVLVESASGRQWKDYWAVNVLGLVGAVDLAGSGMATDAATRGDLEPGSWRIDPKRAAHFRIFRLAESPDLVVVDEAVRRAVVRVALPDVELIPLPVPE